MANDCSNGITFYSKNREQVAKLVSDFRSVMNNKKHWSGYALFAEKFLPQEWDGGLRGFVNMTAEEFVFEDELDAYGYYSFKIYTITAWSANMEMWRDIVAQHYPDVNIAYIAEECGCEYFVKWDEVGYYPERFYVSRYIEDNNGVYEECIADSEYFEVLEDCVLCLADGIRNEELKKLYDKFLENLDNYDADKISQEIEDKLDELGILGSLYIAEYMDLPLSEF